MIVDVHTPDPGSVPLRDAATVMLLRDGRAGVEVMMLRRNLKSDFVGGAYVFPGGGVDPEDGSPEVAEVCLGRDDKAASRAIGVDMGGLAYWVAAIRESFEEAGLLMAVDGDGELVDLHRADRVPRFLEHRRAVDASERRLVEVCHDEGLRLAVDRLHYFSRWVTPLGAPRRYDTRFFVAVAPAEQTALHDDREVIANRWVRPDQALDECRAGRFEMIFPTIRTLEALRRFDTADDVVAHAASLESVEAVVPTVVEADGGVRIVLPGDATYDAVTALPVDGA